MTTLITIIVIAVGATLRYSLTETKVSEFLSQSNEVVTPLTSWKRVTEGLALKGANVEPYSGDLLHELDQQAKEVSTYSLKSEELFLRTDDLKFTSYYVALAWSFSPWAIAACSVKSTAVFTNMFIALCLHSIVTGRYTRACLAVSVSAYLSLYPILLVVPIFVALINKNVEEKKKTKSTISERQIIMYNIIYAMSLTLGFLIALLYLSFMINNSWDFIQETYGFTLMVPDYTPNLGVFWYFFAEMFEHFRSFFLVVFQMNIFLYAVPLAIRFREEPMFLSCILLIFISVFKSYPSYADLSIYMALLPIWKHLSTWIRNGLVVGVMLLVSSILAPVLSYLWLWAGSANANFYFAISLVHATAQIFLVTDIIYAFLRRKHALKHASTSNNSSGVLGNQTEKVTSGYEILQVDFEKKLFIVFIFWLGFNLILIRVAWRIYGPQVAEFFLKDSEDSGEIHPKKSAKHSESDVFLQSSNNSRNKLTKSQSTNVAELAAEAVVARLSTKKVGKISEASYKTPQEEIRSETAAIQRENVAILNQIRQKDFKKLNVDRRAIEECLVVHTEHLSYEESRQRLKKYIHGNLGTELEELLAFITNSKIDFNKVKTDTEITASFFSTSREEKQCKIRINYQALQERVNPMKGYCKYMQFIHLEKKALNYST
ncbi:DgyrCDS6647 [Dimorphilus gyrociliatus]|uniref:DgyrCDS6647 n=1 Tax=Dimorphilus gyrociliatus TaxID=2664684 RepID=A0A7I8VNM5_9ANNE|nr:DgyrCDS6647 [Dimorphilus gyrociliatus]